MLTDLADWSDWTLSIDDVQQLAFRWVLLTAAVTLVPHALVWGVPLPDSWAGLWQDLGRWLWHVFVLGLVYLVNIPIHEGLHVLAMRASADVPWRSITFGAKLRAGAVYVHTDAPMTVRAYRIVLLTPAVVQGVLPAIAGLATGWGWLTVYAWLMLASALGDAAMYRHIRSLPPGTVVRDHPHEVGCLILRGSDTPASLAE